MKKYLHTIFLAALFSVCINVDAQQLYRWKDQSGATHVSDQIPPSSCVSNDCRSIREEVDGKSRKAKKAAEEAAAQKKKSDEMDAERLKSAQLRILKCREVHSKCLPSNIKGDIGIVAHKVGILGMLNVLGVPDKKQEIEGRRYADNTFYWYYSWGGETLQLIWHGTYTSADLVGINLY